MMSLLRYLVVSLFFTFLGFTAQAETVDVHLPPAQLVEKVSNAVLDEIRRDPHLAAAEPAYVRKLVDDYILPYSDFARMTRLAVGPAWKKATEEERAEIQNLFRQLLVAIYSGALKEVQDFKVVLKPNKGNDADNQVLIRTSLVSQTREPIPLDYRLLKEKSGDWKIFDVNVGGVWLVENYRSQFASVINQGGISGLIQQLKDRVQKVSAK